MNKQIDKMRAELAEAEFKERVRLWIEETDKIGYHGLPKDYDFIQELANRYWKLKILWPKYWISTTIKKPWLDKILSGEKPNELKGKNKYWETRIEPLLNMKCGEVGLNLLNGRDSYKFLIKEINVWHGDEPTKIDDEEYLEYYEIIHGIQLTLKK